MYSDSLLIYTRSCIILFAANFTYRGSRTIGAGAEGVRVNGYVGQFHGDDVKILVTADGDCMPVSYMAYGEHGQGAVFNLL